MNTIIIHPFNRAKNTTMHDMSAALIAPVSKWYIKPTPWWIDSFEEVGLQPIAETDEIVEEDDDVIYEQEEPAVEDEEPEVVAFVDFQCIDEGEHTSLDETDTFQDIALDGMHSSPILINSTLMLGGI